MTEDILDHAIMRARSLRAISDEDVVVIKQARKSLLFKDDTSWIKRGDKPMFDIAMGRFDGAEVCNLVGLFIISRLAKEFGTNSIILYLVLH